MVTEGARIAAERARPTASAGRLRRALDSDFFYSFRRSPVTVAAAIVTAVLVGAALLCPWIAPHDPFALATVSILDANDPPAWVQDGTWVFPLGTDDQGRDMLSAILYGTRLSIAVGFAAVAIAAAGGVGFGLLAGFAGGWIDTLIMRLADVLLSFPAILVALLVDGIARSVLPRDQQDQIAFYVVVLAISVLPSVQFARTV